MKNTIKFEYYIRTIKKKLEVNVNYFTTNYTK